MVYVFNRGVGSAHITVCPCVVCVMFIVCFVYADCILRVCYWLFAFVFFVEVTSVKVHSY